jgi:hypothetical protein
MVNHTFLQLTRADKIGGSFQQIDLILEVSHHNLPLLSRMKTGDAPQSYNKVGLRLELMMMCFWIGLTLLSKIYKGKRINWMIEVYRGRVVFQRVVEEALRQRILVASLVQGQDYQTNPMIIEVTVKVL